jgi:CRP-like cAMP-binding protein
MLEHSILRTLKTGERLIEPDSQNQHLHLILEGSLNVYLLEKESQQYTVLSAGECVGEISIVDGKNPSALGCCSRTGAYPVHSCRYSLVDAPQFAPGGG